MTQKRISIARQKHLRAIQKEREELRALQSVTLADAWSLRISYLLNNVALKLQTWHVIYVTDSLMEHSVNIERYYMEPVDFSEYLMEHCPWMLDVADATAMFKTFDQKFHESLVIEYAADWPELFAEVCELLNKLEFMKPVLKLLPPLIVMDDGEFPLQITFDWSSTTP